MTLRSSLAKTSRPLLGTLGKEQRLMKTLRPLKEERTAKGKANVKEIEVSREREVKEMPTVLQLKGCKYIHSPLLTGSQNLKLNEDIDAYMDCAIKGLESFSTRQKKAPRKKSEESRNRIKKSATSHLLEQKEATTKASYLLANNRQNIKEAAPYKQNTQKKAVSKVKQNIQSRERSVTPTTEIKQSKKSDQKQRYFSRDTEIQELSSNLRQLKREIDYKQQNKSQILECYRSESSRAQSNCDFHNNEGKNNNKKETTDSTTGRTLSSWEYLPLLNPETNKDFRYLEICGITSEQVLERLTEKSEAPKSNTNMEISESVTPINYERRQTGDFGSEVQPFYNDLEIISQEVQVEDEGWISESREQELERICRQVEEETKGDSLLEDESFLQKRNEIRIENQKLVNHFQQIYEEISNQRKSSSAFAFYSALSEYDFSKKQLDEAVFRDSSDHKRIALSPTKRLICMKNSSVEHLKEIRERNLGGMVYMASPQRSYVVREREPLNYKLAWRKDPSKFIDDALSKSVQKTKIFKDNDSYSPPRDRDSMTSLQGSKTKTLQKRKKKDFEVFTVESKRAVPRPHQKISQKILQKIETKLLASVGQEITNQILGTLEDADDLTNGCVDEVLSQRKSQYGALLDNATSCQSLPLCQQRSCGWEEPVHDAISERFHAGPPPFES